MYQATKGSDFLFLYFLIILASFVNLVFYDKFMFLFVLCASDPWYIEVGEAIVNSLNLHTKVEGGYASIRDVTTMQLEDHQHSFFLAET